MVGEVGSIEEVCEEGGDGFGRVDTSGAALGAGESIVYIWIPGHDGDDVGETGGISFLFFRADGAQVQL